MFVGVWPLKMGEEFFVFKFGVGEEVVVSCFGFGEERVFVGELFFANVADADAEDVLPFPVDF